MWALASLASPGAQAADLIVAVRGVADARGEIGCALYGSESGFPANPAQATAQWHKAQSPGVDCRFEGVAPGVYAVAVSHDLNGNRKTDTNFLGMPTEAWGVSNNARPGLRAPSFAEAAFRLDDGAAQTIEIRVLK